MASRSSPAPLHLPKLLPELLQPVTVPQLQCRPWIRAGAEGGGRRPAVRAWTHLQGSRLPHCHHITLYSTSGLLNLSSTLPLDQNDHRSNRSPTVLLLSLV